MKEIPLNFLKVAGYIISIGFCPVIGLGIGYWIAGALVAIVAVAALTLVLVRKPPISSS